VALRHARLDAAASRLTTGDRALSFALAPRLAQNRAWFDASSAAWLAGRDLALRGAYDGGRFVARTLWPEDFRLGPAPPAARALPDAPSPALQLRGAIRVPLGADAPFDAASLWERRPGDGWKDKAVLAFVLNGAQGDDDEAHAGHFAASTGRIADDGAIGAWLVDNFYSLDIESEKGILAAPVPLDGYQGDVNAGQSWYRPSWLVAAVLDDDRAADRVQSALGRVYRQFWRHQLAYYHPTDNCTSITVDTLRALGLPVPHLGPTSRLVAPLAFPALALRERSLAKGRISYDYLVTERTRLLPALALEAVFDVLWTLATRGADASHGVLARELAADLCALALVRVPQFPSSRALGAPPVVSLAEYASRLPPDPAHRRIVPVPARPFPDELRDPDLLPPLPHPSDLAQRVWTLAPLLLVALALILVAR
jgi:hypothetical protein